jgi:hypothetical protein
MGHNFASVCGDKTEALTNGSGAWGLFYGTASVDHADAPAPVTISWTSNIMSTLRRVVPEN